MASPVDKPKGPSVMAAAPPAGPAVPQKITLGAPWPADKYTKISKLGRGSFGEAWLARSRALGNKLVVCKEVNVSQMSERERQDALNEVRIIRALNHPNVIQLYDWFSYSSYLVMVMEYADGGDLLRRVKTYRNRGIRLKEDMIMNWLVQMLLAVAYLHSKRILHRDIKAENIFLTSGNIVKVGDFGISTVLRHTMAQAQTVCGTPYYFSPELCSKAPYNNKSDVWALGVVAYECAALAKPFEARSLPELTKLITRGTYPPLPKEYTKEFHDLIVKMLTVDTTQRFGIPQLLRLPILKTALEKWETSQDAVLKENQPGLPPGFGVLARRAAADKDGGGAAGANSGPGISAASVPRDDGPRRAEDRGGRVSREASRDRGSGTPPPGPGDRAAAARLDILKMEERLAARQQQIAGGAPGARPGVAGVAGVAGLRSKSPVSGAAQQAGGRPGNSPLGGAAARRGPEGLAHLQGQIAARKQERDGGAGAPRDYRADRADDAFRMAMDGLGDNDVKALRADYAAANLRANESIKGLIRQLLTEGIGREEDFADAEGIPVDIK